MVGTDGKTAIVTGISGQDGSYLADLLLEKGYTVIGLTRDNKCEFRDRVAHLDGKVTLISTDYSQAAIEDVINKFSPDEIYNMAGQTYVGKSWMMVDETIHASGVMPTHLLQAILACDPAIKFFQASSSEIYSPSDATPIGEGSQINPSTPYGCSKALAHQMVCAFRSNYDLFAVNGVFFSHESPRRGDDFLTKKVVREALKIKAGLTDTLKLGNLNVQRDWGHAKEFVNAAYLLMQQETPEDYHICTGTLHSVEDIVKYVFSYLDLDYTQYVSSDTNLVRSKESMAVLGCNKKIKNNIGWSPSTTLEQLLIEMIEFEQNLNSENG